MRTGYVGSGKASFADMGILDLPDFPTIFAFVLAFAGLAIGLVAVPGTGFWEFLVARAFFVAAAVLFGWKLTAWGLVEFTVFRVMTVGILGGVLSIGLVISLHWVAQKERLSTPAAMPLEQVRPKPASFRELFDHDFKYLKLSKEISVTDSISKTDYTIPVQLMLDYISGTKFLAIFLKQNTNSFASGRLVLAELQYIMETMNDVVIHSRTPGDTSATISSDYIFSKTIYFYMEDDLSLESQATLEKTFKEQGISTQFRGHAYHVLRWYDPEIVKAISSKATVGSTAATSAQM